jgi:hypothetical protein
VFFAPDRYVPTVGATALQIGGEMQKLTEKVQLLKQEQIVSPEKADVLEMDLDRLREEAIGNDPAKTMEAIDHLEQSFNKSAAEAAESAIQQTETATRVQELAEAISESHGKMGSEQLNAAMKELARMAERAAAENNLLAENLSTELREACENSHFSNEQLRELDEALKHCKACDRAKIEKMIRAKLIDVAQLRCCDKAGECDEAALACALCQCKNGQQCTAALAYAGKGGPGGGGPPAAMTWTQEASREGVDFKEKALSPSAVSSLRESRLTGISVGNPTSEKPAGGSTEGVLAGAHAGGGAANVQIILPEHEKTVQRYFDRQTK